MFPQCTHNLTSTNAPSLYYMKSSRFQSNQISTFSRNISLACTSLTRQPSHQALWPALPAHYKCPSWWATIFYIHIFLPTIQKLSFRISIAGTFLVFQGLRLCAPNTKGPGWTPGQGTRSLILKRAPQLGTKIPSAAAKPGIIFLPFSSL